MAITGPIIPAKSQVPGAVPSITTTIANSLVDTPSTEVDRAVQVGEIISNVADGKLWLKKSNNTFAPVSRSRTLAIWTADSAVSSNGTANLFSVNGPRPTNVGSGPADLLPNIETTSTGTFSVMAFTEGGLTDKQAFFHGIIPEGASWSSLNLIVKCAVGGTSGSGTVQWFASMQKPTGPADATFGTELSNTGSINLTSWTTISIPLAVPSGLVEGDFYRIKLRRSISTTNDTYTDKVHLLTAELRATL